MSTFNQKSSFTADGIAYRRTFTDIPLSREIWDILLEIKGQPAPDEWEWMKKLGLVPYIEARYRLTDRELQRSGIKQIFELAPGLSSRGLIMTQSPDVIYVEMDLSDKISTKKKVVGELIKRKLATTHSHLHLEAGNVINTNDFKRATAHFRQNEPVAVVCEGLLRYINFADKEILSRNIFELLKRHGGIWITPDTESQHSAHDAAQSGRGILRFLKRLGQKKKSGGLDTLKKITGLEVGSNLFRDEAHAQSFFENIGFSITKYRLAEMTDELVCSKKYNVTAKMVENVLRGHWTYVMR